MRMRGRLLAALEIAGFGAIAAAAGIGTYALGGGLAGLAAGLAIAGAEAVYMANAYALGGEFHDDG